MLAELPLPTPLTADLTLRRAREDDLAALMRLLSDDAVSAGRGDRSDPVDVPLYAAALAELITDPANEVVMVVNDEDAAIATMQLTRIPGMARRGATRLLVEAVRVSSAQRSGGVGSAMMRWVMGPAAQATRAGLVQLTSDEARTDAHRFYERLGFVGSHRGFKYRVEQQGD